MVLEIKKFTYHEDYLNFNNSKKIQTLQTLKISFFKYH